MKNILAMIGLLLGGFCVALACGADRTKAAQIGISAVFFFTALGHFARRGKMMEMLPAVLPARSALVISSGVLEILLAAGALFSVYSRVTGWAICVFLVVVTPVNVYAALKRVDFGGHGAGPKYLFVRIPLQILLFAWTYWFLVHTHGA
jgi:uncharacterized membrane protein